MPYFENLRKYIPRSTASGALCFFASSHCDLLQRRRAPDSCSATHAQICIEAAIRLLVSCPYPPPIAELDFTYIFSSSVAWRGGELG